MLAVLADLVLYICFSSLVLNVGTQSCLWSAAIGQRLHYIYAAIMRPGHTMRSAVSMTTEHESILILTESVICAPNLLIGKAHILRIICLAHGGTEDARSLSELRTSRTMLALANSNGGRNSE